MGLRGYRVFKEIFNGRNMNGEILKNYVNLLKRDV